MDTSRADLEHDTGQPDNISNQRDRGSETLILFVLPARLAIQSGHYIASGILALGHGCSS